MVFDLPSYSFHPSTGKRLVVSTYCRVLAILSACDLAISSRMFDTLPKTDLFLNTTVQVLIGMATQWTWNFNGASMTRSKHRADSMART